MNIDALNLNTLLSTGEGLQKLQQSLQADGAVAQGFSDTLLEKIKQLNGTGEASTLPENFMLKTSVNIEKLQGLAGLLNQKGVPENFSSLLGKDLPISNKLGQDIDLDSTLDALNSVMNALENFGLETKLDALVEKVEQIKQAVPEQVEQVEKLNKIVEELKGIKANILNGEALKINSANIKDIASLDFEIDQKEPELSVEEDLHVSFKENQQFISQEELENNVEDRDDKSLISENKELEGQDDRVIDENLLLKEQASQPVNLAGRLDNIIEKINHTTDLVTKEQISDELEDGDLESRLEFLTAEVASIKEAFSQKMSEKLNLKQQGNQFLDKHEYLHDKEDDSLQVASQIASLVATMSEPLNIDKIATESKVAGQALQEMKPELKREDLMLKSMPEEKNSGIATKVESDTQLQQENQLGKPAQDNPIIAAGQRRKVDGAEIELGNEKSAHKFATDLATLNRAVITENKAEIPPMTKHFAHPEWNKEMGERVIWMHKQEIPSAELRLNPRHLGPITIKVDVTQDQATVAFTAQHAVVKEAIEAALPKLREMFSAQQLNLADVNVSQNDSGQKQARDSNQMGNGAGGSDNNDRNGLFNGEQADKKMDIADEIEAGRAIASNGVLSIFA